MRWLTGQGQREDARTKRRRKEDENLYAGSEIYIRQAPNAGRFSVWRVNLGRLSPTLEEEVLKKYLNFT